MTVDEGHWEPAAPATGKAGCADCKTATCRHWVCKPVTKEVPYTTYETTWEEQPVTCNVTVMKPETRTRTVKKTNYVNEPQTREVTCTRFVPEQRTREPRSDSLRVCASTEARYLHGAGAPRGGKADPGPRLQDGGQDDHGSSLLWCQISGRSRHESGCKFRDFN